ncbi:Dynein light chain [Tulasnella sp. UAMH 9824]|nr:Dynein light chain [Tulasnella sp. UAMH 9824]
MDQDKSSTSPEAGGEPGKTTIKNVDMTEEMQKEAIEICQAALAAHKVEKDIASYCKKEFDKKYGPTWHAVVGKNFGSYVTHETKHFIYFYIGPLAFLIWKS